MARLISPLPSPEEVRIESRLRPEQVRADLASESDLEVEIEKRIAENAAWAEGRLVAASKPFVWPLPDGAVRAAYGDYSTEMIEQHRATQQEQAALAVKQRTLASLYRSAGMGHEFYQRLADSYYKDAEITLKALLDDVALVSQASTSTSDDLLFSVSLGPAPELSVNDAESWSTMP